MMNSTQISINYPSLVTKGIVEDPIAYIAACIEDLLMDEGSISADVRYDANTITVNVSNAELANVTILLVDYLM